MKLVELLNIANEGYDDGFLSEYFDTETGELKDGSGDTLAKFIVIELAETFDPESKNEWEQMATAVDAMNQAIRDIEGVIDKLYSSQFRKACVERASEQLKQQN